MRYAYQAKGNVKINDRELLAMVSGKELPRKILNSFKSGMVGDVTFKLIANVVSTIIRNIIVLPVLARYFTNTQYGQLVTVIGVITTITAGLGNALLSTRLVMESEYKKSHVEGDFNLICIIVSLVSVVFTIPIAIYFSSISGVQVLFTGIILFLETYVGYHSGWFILKQAYRKLLVYTLVGGIGFGVGILLTKFTGFWTLTYMCSDILSCAFLFFLSPHVKEKRFFTKILKITLSKYWLLFLTTIITNALAYLDRLLLYPLIGSEAVATYTTASVFGKAFNLIAIPVSSILLGYYATERIKLTKKKFWIINGITLVLLGAFILVTRVIGVWFTGILYPTIIDDARPYILIANLSSALGASAQITKSAALKYAKTYWTLIIQITYAAIYAGGGFLAAKSGGLREFAEVILVANVVQLIVLYIVCNKSLSQFEMRSDLLKRRRQ